MDAFLNALTDILSEVFEKIFLPVLRNFFELILTALINVLKKAFSFLLYWLFTSLLSVVDFLVKIFEFFSGSEDVVYSSSEGKLPLSVLELFFKVDGIQKAFLVITCLAIGLSFIFTVYAVAKSISDMALENKNPIGKVLGSALKCCFTFMLVPFLCIFMLKLSTIVLDGVDTALSVRQESTPENQNNYDVSLATVLWLSSGMNAAKNDLYNISSKPNYANFTDIVRDEFYSRGTNWKYGSKAVTEKFNYDKFNYGIGFVSCIFVIIMLMASVLLFIRRIFEIIILYLTSPLFVSTMPLDEGGMFRQWKDMFIAKFFSAFSCVFSIRLYVMFVPVFASGAINLYPDNAEISYFLLLLFLIGGAYAVYKSHHILLTLLQPDAAAAAEQSASTVIHTARAAWGITGRAKNAAIAGMKKQGKQEG